MTEQPWSRAADGLRLRVRLQPGARSERVVGLVEEAGGQSALKVSVTAAAEKGRANDALIRLLARLLRLPPSAFSVALGATDRRKVLAIAGEPGELAVRVSEGLGPWLKPR